MKWVNLLLFRGVFRTLSNSDDVSVMRDQLTTKSCQLFSQKAPLSILDKVPKTPVVTVECTYLLTTSIHIDFGSETSA